VIAPVQLQIYRSDIRAYEKRGWVAGGAAFLFCIVMINKIRNRPIPVQGVALLAFGCLLKVAYQRYQTSKLLLQRRAALLEAVLTAHAFSKTVFAHNNLKRSFPGYSEEDYRYLYRTFHLKLGHQRARLLRNYQTLPYQNPLCFVLVSHSEVHQTNYGNCGEMCAYTFVELIKRYGLNVKIDIYRVEGGDHNVIVIGRPLDSDPDDFTTWGEALVYDPWASRLDQPLIFFARDIPRYLKDSRNISGAIEALRVDIDFSRQKLTLKATNIFSEREFLVALKGETNATLTSIQRLLALFHQNKTPEIAREMIRLGRPLIEQHQGKKEYYLAPPVLATSTLITQLQMYLGGR
jgi:hypothetical protein